jgi:hypothetical protein
MSLLDEAHEGRNNSSRLTCTEAWLELDTAEKSSRKTFMWRHHIRSLFPEINFTNAGLHLELHIELDYEMKSKFYADL